MAATPTGDCRNIEAIKSLSAAIDAQLANGTRHQFFGNIADAEKWREATEGLEGEHSAANVYRLARRIRKVDRTVSTESGDWVLYATYY
jgi:hypothetical protein